MLIVSDSTGWSWRTEVTPGHPLWLELEAATYTMLRQRIGSGAGEGECDLTVLLEKMRSIAYAAHYNLGYMNCMALYKDGLTALRVPHILTRRASLESLRAWHAEAAPCGLVAFVPGIEGTMIYASDIGAAVLIRMSF